MKYTEEEKQAIEECEELIKKKYYGDMYFYERRSIQIVLNLLQKQQKETEKYKRIAKMNLKDGEEFKNEMCEHRCILKSELEENYISKELIREKIKEIEDSLKEDCIALHEFQRLAKIDVLKELLGE